MDRTSQYIAITLAVTGQEDNKDRKDDKDAEEYNEAEKAFAAKQGNVV